MEAAGIWCGDLRILQHVLLNIRNPCGAATASTLHDAYVNAYEADSVSAFGGIVALNREVDAATAEEMSKIFLEVIMAPASQRKL